MLVISFKVPTITGAMQDDGRIVLAQFFENKDLVDEVEANFDIDGSMLLLGVDEDSVTPEDKFVTNLFKKHFLGSTKFSNDNMERIGKMFSMIHFLIHADIEASMLAHNNEQPVYYYQYKYVTLLLYFFCVYFLFFLPKGTMGK